MQLIISDIDNAGASADVLTANRSVTQLTIGGTWNGGSVNVEKFIKGPNVWVAITTLTENGMIKIEHVNGTLLRTNTTHGGSAPVLTAEWAQ